MTALATMVLPGGPAIAQSPAERIGDWTIAKIAVSEGGNVCSALRLYGGGYGVEIVQARGLPGQLILRLESPKIRYRPGQTGEEIEPGENLQIVIGNISGQEGADAIVRQGPRGLGFVTTLKDTNDRFSPVRNLRSGQAIRAYVAFADGTEDKLVGSYSLTGSGAALDALARCAAGQAATEPRPATSGRPAPTPSPAPKNGRPDTATVLPVPFGKYAVDQSCAGAAAANDYLGLSRNYWSEIDGDTPIGPFRNLGGNRWALGHGSGLTITVTGPKTFSENGRRMMWCKP